MKYPIGVRYKEGGKGSGNFGHSGRQGQHGGSGKSGQGDSSGKYTAGSITFTYVPKQISDKSLDDSPLSTIKVSPGKRPDLTPRRAKQLEKHLKKLLVANDVAAIVARDHG